MERGAVFIDAGYIQKVQEALRVYIDYLKLSEKICHDANVERFKTYYYDCMPYQSDPPTVEESKAYAARRKKIFALERLPRFEVKLGRIAKYGDQFRQKGVDNLLTIDMIKLSSKGTVQKAFLISGDSDFVPAVKAVRADHIIVQILYYKDEAKGIGIHNELYNCADERVGLDKEYLKAVLMTPRSK